MHPGQKIQVCDSVDHGGSGEGEGDPQLSPSPSPDALPPPRALPGCNVQIKMSDLKDDKDMARKIKRAAEESQDEPESSYVG